MFEATFLQRKMWVLTFAFEKRDYQTPPAHVPETFGGLVIGQTKMIEFLKAQRGAKRGEHPATI